MADMLRTHSTKYFGCCDHCARNVAIPNKPGPRERHQARARVLPPFDDSLNLLYIEAREIAAQDEPELRETK